MFLDTQEKESFGMAQMFEIRKNKKGEFRVRFKYDSEVLYPTEGYSSKASRKNAISSIL